MSDDRVLLSIVVPTRNRAQYATAMIESILRLEGSDFELVVSDNSDEDVLEDWVACLPKDTRMVYERATGPLSMTGNSNRAFRMARGEFVCFIGDDDTVLPSILDSCRWMHREKFDALTPDTPIRYCWPDMLHRYWGDRQAGMLYVDPWGGHVWDGYPQREAFDCMRRAGQGTSWLPKLYHGIVRRSLLEALRAETGDYCFSVSPDVYMAMALARMVRRQACTDVPLTIPGSSGASNAGRSAKGQQKGDIGKDPHMVRFRNEPWPRGVPEFFSRETVWAQASLEAARRVKWDEMLSVFNFPYLYALCLINHLDYWHEIRKAVSAESSAQQKRNTSLWLSIATEIPKVLAVRSWYYAKRIMRPTPRGYSQEYGPYGDIRSASEFASSILITRGTFESGSTLAKERLFASQAKQFGKSA